MKGKTPGAVNNKLSTRSSTPPCPGNNLPVSFIPRSRFTAEIVISPRNPATPIRIPAIRLSHVVSDVNQGPINTADSMVILNPPANPSAVLFGLTLIIAVVVPNNLPKVYCATSFSSVRNTKNTTRTALEVIKPPSDVITKTNPTYPSKYTVNIKPQLSVLIALMKPGVSPAKTILLAKNKNTISGTNITKIS